MRHIRRLDWASLFLVFAAITGGSLAVAEEPGFHPASPQFLLEHQPPAHLALRLLSISVEQDGSVLPEKSPAIRGDGALTLVTRWVPQAAIPSSVPFRVRFWDGLGLISRDYNFRVGPNRREEAWAVGSEYHVRHSIDMGEVGQAFSGDGYIEVAMETPRGRAQSFEPVLLLPISVAPVLHESSALAGVWRQKLGAEARVLPIQVRLGKGASVTIPVAEEWQKDNRVLNVASSVSYQGLPQGQTVCEVVFHHGVDGRDIIVPMRSGIETSRCDIDAYPPGGLRHDRAPIFQSRDSAQLGVNNRPIQLHTYLAALTVPSGVERVSAITFRCESGVVLDIYGAALTTHSSPAADIAPE